MRFLIFFVVVIQFAACTGEATRKAQQQGGRKKLAPKLKKVPKSQEPETREAFDYITDETVVKRLTQYGKENPETVVLIHTTKGSIKAKLYEDTPLHRANFIMLAKEGYFDGTVFTRVVPGFMAQGGGTFEERHAMIKRKLGNYTIPPEFTKKHFHKVGALGASRGYLNNPDLRTAPYAFYFVEGTKYGNKMLDHYERENGYTYPIEHREYYNEYGGAAHIDGLHTVFGEIIGGFETIPKLTEVETDSRDWPKTDIFITKVEVLQ